MKTLTHEQTALRKQWEREETITCPHCGKEVSTEDTGTCQTCHKRVCPDCFGLTRRYDTDPWEVVCIECGGGR